MEHWKDIIGYEGLYQVSDRGRVKSLSKYDRLGRFHSERILSMCDNGKGYLVVNLKVNGSQRMRTVHSLVATAFLPNVENKPCVNHKDGNKRNNSAENLEWVTFSENTIHAVENGLITNFGRKRVVCVETGLVFNSVKEAGEWVGIKCGASRIANCCYGRRGAKTCGGYHWRYV